MPQARASFPRPFCAECFPSKLFPSDPGGDRLPLACLRRRELPPAAVKIVAARLLGEGMDQQPALLGMAGHDVSADRLEVLSRLFVIPCGSARRQELKIARRRAAAMADVTARVARPLFQEDRLHTLPEEFVIEWRRCRLRG